MPRLLLRKAVKEDDNKLRNFCRTHNSEGLIEFGLERDPSFLDALEVEGDVNDVMVAMDLAKDKVVGMALRSEKKCYVNGVPTQLGYINGLRISETYRNGLMLSRGYQFLKKLHQQSNCSAYLTTIFEDNLKAQEILTSKRGKLPTYYDIGCYHTIVFKPVKFKSTLEKKLIIRRARMVDIGEIVRFLNQEGRRRQFFPLYETYHFEKNSGLLRGLLIENVVLAYRNGKLVGMMALWDQTGFRQWKIKKYKKALRYLIPFINAFAWAQRKPFLPKAGETINYKILSLVCVKNDDSLVFNALLKEILNKLEQEEIYLAIGFHDSDPLLKTFPLPKVTFKSHLYLVYWDDNDTFAASLDERYPYLELGSI